MSLLEVENLIVGYEVPLLLNLSFSAERGEILGILGRNGSGKTTLLRGLAGSVRRFSGHIMVDGKQCDVMKVRELACWLSMLPQSIQIMEGILVREVIEMGLYPHRKLFRNMGPENATRIAGIAESLGISHLLETDCGKLSQGQRQMVLFARLLVQDTPVMLLDEPNAALDYDNSQMMFSLLRDLVRRERKTALVVLHDPEQALRWCDRLLILQDGMLLTDQCVNTGENALSQALSQLYPGIYVRKDPLNGHFRCYTENECKEASLC